MHPKQSAASKTNAIRILQKNGEMKTLKNILLIKGISIYLFASLCNSTNAIGQVLDERPPFVDGLAAVYQNNKYGYIDITRKLVIPPIYDNAKSFSEGLAAVLRNQKWGYIDNTGKIVISHQYTDAAKFSDGLAAVSQNGEVGFIDKTGNIIVPFVYDEANDFSEGLALVKQGNKYGFIDKSSKIVIPLQYDTADYFSEGLAPVKINGKWGYINQKGEMIISENYDRAYPFSEGLARVTKNNKSGFIDHTGSVVIPLKYDHCFPFSEGLSGVELHGKRGYINKKGDIVGKLEYDAAWPHKEGLALVRTKNKKYGYVDLKGDIFIFPQFDGGSDFSEGLARVFSFSGSDMYINSKGNRVIPLNLFIKQHLAEYPSAEEFIKPKVENDINTWQKKDEFESSEQWSQRVNEQTKRNKVEELTKKYIEEYKTGLENYSRQYNKIVNEYFDEKIAQRRKDLAQYALKISSYDADNQSFLITGLPNADIILPVKRENAKSFKENWQEIQKTVEFCFIPDGNNVSLSEVIFHDEKNSYIFDGHSNVKYDYAELNYSFTPLEIAIDTTFDYNFNPINIVSKNTVSIEAHNNKSKINTQDTRGTDVEVDLEIPQIEDLHSSTFAVIIGNENYQKVTKVECANNDAMVFSQYCKKTLGMPEKNVRIYPDATFATMLAAIDDIKSIAKAYKGDLNVVFYYAGHGIPNESSRDAYLLPVDTDGRNTAVCYPLSKLYQELGSMNAKSVVVFMDACFSGAQRGDGMLVSARGIAIKAKPAAPQGNMVVFSAASGDETAYPYKEKNHGMFTYFLLKKLQESKGTVTLGELGSYIIDKVTKESVVSNGKSQTPTVSVSTSYTENWENRSLRNK